jgi:hypothetical protein
MDDIYCFRHELDSVYSNLEAIYLKIFKTKNIIKYLDLNGSNSFNEYFDLRPIDCLYCMEEAHYLHDNKYVEFILNHILENDWRENIYSKYFEEVELVYFWYWIGTYIKSIHTRLINLNIYAC